MSRPEDATLFRAAGESMLGPRFLDVFSNAKIQVGPAYLLAVGVLAKLVEAAGLPVLFALGGIQGAAVTWLALITARRFARASGADEHVAQWAVAMPMVLAGLLAESAIYGHPEEILIALVLANAAISATDRRRWVPGLLVGLASGLKLWGVLGLPLLLAGRRPRDVLLRGAVVVAVVGLCYGPFFLFGNVKTFGFHWAVGARPLLGLALPWLSRPDWTLRVMQGGIASVAGAGAALRQTSSPLSVLVVVIAVRLLLDPLQLSYYPGAFVVVLLLWLWTSPVSVAWVWRLALTTAVPAVVLVPHLAPVRTVDVMSALFLVAAPLWVLWRERAGGRSLRLELQAAT